MSPAARVAGMSLSPIRRMSVGAPADAVDLALGEPGWPLPEVARAALAQVGSGTGPLPYGPNAGRPDLVEAIAQHHDGGRQTALPHRTVARAAPDGRSCQTGRSLVPDQVMVSAGSQAALFALFQAHVDPGTAVLVPDPGFVAYPSLARLCGGQPVAYPLGPGGELDAGALVETLARAPHTSLVVLNHPANPTGGMASPEALVRVAEACARRGVVLVSDEVYRELWVDEPPVSLHDVVGIDGGVVLGSTSKAFGAPGLRVGWAVGDPEVLAPARLVHSAMTTAPAQPSQAAAVALLAAGGSLLEESRARVRERWELAAAVAPRLLAGPPVRSGTTDRQVQRAGIYLWLRLPERLLAAAAAAETAATDDPTLAVALHLREHARVVTVPGSAFGPRGARHLRVSLGGPPDRLEEGLRRLAPWWEA